jgi:hypothetical protein
MDNRLYMRAAPGFPERRRWAMLTPSMSSTDVSARHTAVLLTKDYYYALGGEEAARR